MYNKEHYQQNKTKILRQNKKWREQHKEYLQNFEKKRKNKKNARRRERYKLIYYKEKSKSQCKKYRETHQQQLHDYEQKRKERKNERKKIWRKKHLEQEKESRKKWLEKNPDYQHNHNQKYRKENPEKCKYDYIKNKNPERMRIKNHNHTSKRRKLGCITTVNNIFPQEIPIDYHHINDLLIVTLPRIEHKGGYARDKKIHRQKLEPLVELYYTRFWEPYPNI